MITFERAGMTAKKNNGAPLSFEETLWQAADKMRGHSKIRMNLKGLGFDV